MTFDRLQKGKTGEDLAVSFLKEQGYTIVERNYKTLLGEIDIIAKEKGVICFVEVKTRSSHAMGTGFDAISSRKQRKMSQAALSFLKHKRLLDREARFDAISILSDKEAGIQIDIIKDAFPLSQPYSY